MLHRQPWITHVGAAVLLLFIAWATTRGAIRLSYSAAAVVPLRGTAYAALGLLCLTLSLGPLARLWPRWFGALLPARRAAGIWSAVAGGAHLLYALEYLTAYGKETLRQVFFAVQPMALGMSIPRGPKGWVPDLTPTGIACWVGIVALTGLAVLALTSSDLAERWLGQGSWKWLHSRVYGIFALVLLHYALVSISALKGSPPRLHWFWWVVAATVLLQAAAFVATTRRRRRS